MKEIKLPSGEYVLVGVPDAHLYYILDSCNNKGQGLFWKDGTDNPSWEILPTGQWSIIGKADEISSPEKIVEGYGKMYKDYTSKLNGLAAHSLTAKESFKSLIASHSMKPQTTLILRKQLSK